MATKPPGVQQPNPIRNKSVVSVSSKGKITSAPIIKHPSPVERIAFIHRNTQSALRTIARALDPALHKRSK